jgi:protoheme IX farnesyltransferase
MRDLQKMKRRLGVFLELGKVRISSLATISMITGYVLVHGGPSWALVILTAGVFLIACGSATINHIQEREIDARMQRTCGRPLPSGRVALHYAWGFAAASIACGSVLILIASNVTVMLLGFLSIFWYNAVYTPLKRLTAFASVPGGIIGAIPPIMGWVAGGGEALDPRILAVAFFFFIWQVPHFWLLLLFSCGKDYERAGLPSLTRLFTMDQIARVTFVWIFATAVTSLVIPLFDIVSNGLINAGLVAAGAWLVWKSLGILRAPWGMVRFRNAFKQINVFVVWIIALLSINGVIT